MTPSGFAAYQGGKNPDFGVICGDQIITEFKTGAMLATTLDMQFQSRDVKQQFATAFGSNFGSFANLSAKIENIAHSLKISGKVVIHGYQLGGTP